jgi:hypothetical protein
MSVQRCLVPYYLEERTINVKLGRAARRDAPGAALQVGKDCIISARPGCAPQFARLGARPTRLAMDRILHWSSHIVITTARSCVVRWV